MSYITDTSPPPGENLHQNSLKFGNIMIRILRISSHKCSKSATEKMKANLKSTIEDYLHIKGSDFSHLNIFLIHRVLGATSPIHTGSHNFNALARAMRVCRINQAKVVMLIQGLDGFYINLIEILKFIEEWKHLMTSIIFAQTTSAKKPDLTGFDIIGAGKVYGVFDPQKLARYI